MKQRLHTRQCNAQRVCHLGTPKIVSRKIEHAQEIALNRLSLKLVLADANVGSQQTPVIARYLRKPFGISQASLETIRMADKLDSRKFEDGEQTPISAMVFVQKENEGG